MSLNTSAQNPSWLRAALNRANVQSLSEMFQYMALGDVLGTLHVPLYGVKPLGVAGYPYTVQAGAFTYPLPDDAKCAVTGLASAYGRVGTATSENLTIDTQSSAAPAAGHAHVSGSGDVLFNSADAWTSVDVQYRPVKQDVIELFLPVVSGTGVCLLPTEFNGANPGLAVSLLEAQSTAGTVTGACDVQPIGGTPATTTWANLDVTLTKVLFVIADAVTSCRVKVGCAPRINLQALLESACNFI